MCIPEKKNLSTFEINPFTLQTNRECIAIPFVSLTGFMTLVRGVKSQRKVFTIVPHNEVSY